MIHSLFLQELKGRIQQRLPDIEFALKVSEIDGGKTVINVTIPDQENPASAYIAKEDEKGIYLEMYDSKLRIQQIIGEIRLTGFYIDDDTLLNSLAYNIATDIKNTLESPAHAAAQKKNHGQHIFKP